MRLAPYLDSFSDELTKIAGLAATGALIGGALGAASGGKTIKGRLVRGALGAAAGGLAGGAGSAVKSVTGENHRQLAAAQVRPWEPDGYVPSYARQY